MKQTIGIIIALPSEAVRILGRRGWRKEAGRAFRRQPLDSATDLLCAISGTGIENGYAVGKRLVEHDGVTALINTGVSGGLRAGVGTAELILAEKIVRVDDAGRCCAIYPVNAQVVAKRLAQENMTLHCGSILGMRRAVLSAESKAALGKEFDALAVDMESAGVAMAAEEGNVPLIALRSVCDPVTESIPGWLLDVLTPDGTVCSAGFIREIIRRPIAVRELFRMNRRFHAACGSLRKAWSHLLARGLPHAMLESD